MRARLLFLALLSVNLVAVPARSHAPDSGSAPLEGTRVRLRNRTASEVIALFSRAALPDAAHTPRAARAETPDSLLPPGVDGILRGENGEVVLVGARDKCREFGGLLIRLDQALLPSPDGVETRFQCGASAREVARAIRALPGGGTVKVEGSTLSLTGSREWVFRALRAAVQSETRPVESNAEPQL